MQTWTVSTTEDMMMSSRAVCNGLRWKSADRNTQKQKIKVMSKMGVSGVSRGEGGDPGCETHGGLEGRSRKRGEEDRANHEAWKSHVCGVQGPGSHR